MGGRIIRQVLGLLKRSRFTLPLDSHILIAVSGGADSVALARLVVRYGRKLAQPEQLVLLHFDHGWRGDVSIQDARFVQDLAQNWGVRYWGGSGTPGLSGPDRSPEEDARLQRKAFFSQARAQFPGIVLTAHHADDLAETVLWRLLTGAGTTHGGGIQIQTEDGELRPLLATRKADLEAFLAEEGLSHRQDSTNQDPRYLRARVRTQLMPTVQTLFPDAVRHLVEAALQVQLGPRLEPEAAAPQAEVGQALAQVAGILGDAGLRLRRPHVRALQQGRSVSLPGGWRLEREPQGKPLQQKGKVGLAESGFVDV